MAQMAPPEFPPLVAVSDDDSMNRARFRLWQLMLTAVTILCTAWFVTLGAIPAIIALLIAKHVLVAILMIGLDREAVWQGKT